MCLCIIFSYISKKSHLVDQNNISVDCYQMRLLLNVCLALDFIQDQESVKKGPLGAQNTVLIVSLTVDFFL